MRIGWLSRNLTPNTASARYRVLLPAVGLSRLGIDSSFFSNPRQASEAIENLDCLVVGKVIDAKFLAVAARAYEANLPIIIDICDNVFLPEYGKNSRDLYARCFSACTAFASAIVTTGPALADVVATKLGGDLNIIEIPDPVETRSLAENLVASSFDGVVKKQTQPHVLDYTLQQATSSVTRNKHTATTSLRSLQRKMSKLSHHVTRGLRLKLRGSKSARDTFFDTEKNTRRKRLVWFGNYGASYSDFGMLSILRIADHLISVNQKIPIELLVISNNLKMFRTNIEPLPINTFYQPWDLLNSFEQIESADVCVLPQSSDQFARTKSANRTALALSLGVPVVASALEALEPFKKCIQIENWYENICSYLTDERLAHKDIETARVVIKENYSLEIIAKKWFQVIDQAVSHSCVRKIDKKSNAQLVTLLIQLPMDFDLLFEVALRIRDTDGFKLRLMITGEVAAKSPRIIRSCNEKRLSFRLINHGEIAKGVFPVIEKGEIVLTASESSLSPHRTAHLLVKHAKKSGASTYTLQHGLENVGLSYFDNKHDESVEIASQHILTWGRPDSYPQQLPGETRSRCRAIGRTAVSNHSPTNVPLKLRNEIIIGVFENLHWHRYSQGYRDAFVQYLAELIEAHAEIGFLIKPHHAGKWTVQFREVWKSLDNAVFADPGDPEWEPFTAPALMPYLTGVITTPSTVALDAASAGICVGVFAGDVSELTVYNPLPLLREYCDWSNFINAVISCPNKLKKLSREFVTRTLVEGNAIDHLINVLRAGDNTKIPLQNRLGRIAKLESAHAPDGG